MIRPPSVRRLREPLSRPARAAAWLRRTAAFSLIEVLVATTLLILIVVTVGMVFRQSMLSWDSGIQRADGSMLVRSAIGAIERDLRAAVDGRAYTNGVWSDSKAMRLSGSSIEFIAMLPSEGDGPREPALVTLTGGTKVERTAKPLEWSGGRWQAGSGTPITLLSQDSDEPFKASLYFDWESPRAPDDKDMPLWVQVEVELVNTENFSGASVRSLGRDGKPSTKDDILIR